MGRKKGSSARLRKGRDNRGALQRVVDATPERIAKSDGASAWVNPAEIDSSEQPIGRTRQFRDSWVDRLHRRGVLTYAQWAACGWYRDVHGLAFSAQRVVADYGQGAGGAGQGCYGQPMTETQQHHRARYRQARSSIPPQMLTLVEGVLLHDQMPQFANGQQRARFGSRLAAAVQPLAEHLQAPGWWLGSGKAGATETG